MTPHEKRADAIERHLRTVPPLYHGIMQRAFDGTGGRSNAIRAMCLYCVGYERRHIRECTSWTCPLHPYRPYQDGQDTPENEAGNAPESTHDPEDGSTPIPCPSSRSSAISCAPDAEVEP